MNEGKKVIASAVREAHLAWLEGVMTELLASGVQREEIAVHFRNGLRTVVMVRGEHRCEFTPPAPPTDI
jgi:hypothetical protein